ncbi:hypothetical protein [Streptomyces sp. NBC_01565]|uniref:hypothetical protein n=1 Tax=Streptomyces sp. NBC_01565 TaxID=2975881 RepID=UPI00225A5FAF|nr:hypothetical protein [Streptomyces sp. NBC_01565]MCX4542484.1 hypothetical protein [Streptomyces sp. NBC_01565]
MPIDPYAALNAMIRAEAARFTPQVRKAEAPAANSPAARECEPGADSNAESGSSETSERRQTAPADSAA